MATQKTDINKITYTDRTNGISEDVLKKLNLAVKKEITGYNSKIKELNEYKRKKDEKNCEKVTQDIKLFQASIEKGDLARQIESDLLKETNSDTIFNVTHTQLTDNLSDVASEINPGVKERPNYIQTLLQKVYQLNENKINAYKNISPFRRKSDEVIVDPVKNK